VDGGCTQTKRNQRQCFNRSRRSTLSQTTHSSPPATSTPRSTLTLPCPFLEPKSERM